MPAELPLVGREEVLGPLLDAAKAARAGSGSLVLLCGDAGIGKTRALAELAQSALEHEMQVLLGHCLEGGEAAPFWPWAQVLRAWSESSHSIGFVEELGASLAALAGVFPALRDRFPNLAELPALEGEAARFRVFDAATAVLRRSARKRPLVVVLEDLHWGDESSLRLLAFAARDLRDAPVLLAASVRDAEVEESHPLAVSLAELTRVGTPIALEGLDTSGVTLLWQSVTGARPDPALAGQVSERTGGNPLFVLETARGFRESASPTEALETALPRHIRQALRPRVERRSAACRRVLEAAAVVGEEFGVDLLGRVVEGETAQGEALLAALAEAGEVGLVERCPGTDLRHRFAHALVRELLYDDLGPARQMALHGRVARALEAAPDASHRGLTQLAHHACRAAPAGGAEAAIGHAQRAAEEALARHAPEDAVVLYARALDVLRLMPDPRRELHCDLLLALGRAESRAGRREQATDSLSSAAGLARELGSAERLSQIALAFPASHTSSTMSASMGGGRAGELLLEALDRLGPDDSDLRSALLARLARGDAARADLAAEAVAIARRLEDADALATALDAQHYVSWEPHHLPERLAIAAELDRLGRETGNLFTCFRAAHAALGDELELGDRRSLARTLDRLDHVVSRLGQPALGLVSMHTRACEVFLDGDLEGYEERVREALGLARRAGGSDATAVFAGQLSMLRREQDRMDELVPGFERLVARYPGVQAYAIHLAWLHAEAGRVEDARARLAGLEEQGLGALPQDGFLLLNLHFLGETVARAGVDALAEGVYERLLPYAGRAVVLGAVLCFGAVDRTLGALAARLGREAAARGHFDRALDVDAGMEAVPCLVHSRIETARFLLASGGPGDVARAHALLAEARSASERHGLALGAARVAELLREDDAPEVAGPAPVEAEVQRMTREAEVQRMTREAEVQRMTREGDVWLLRFRGREVRLRTSKGLECLATLLAEPGREFPAIELAGSPGARALDGTDGELLDEQAVASYRERLEALRDELEEAERFGDAGRESALRDEMERLAEELAGGVGLGGRARRAAGPAERARKALYNRIRSAIARIRDEHPELARHLEASVRTGSFCVYLPEQPTEWRLG